jgi:hypothetical protein
VVIHKHLEFEEKIIILYAVSATKLYSQNDLQTVANNLETYIVETKAQSTTQTINFKLRFNL